MPHAVELGISLAKVESNIELTESCEAELRQVLVAQTYWDRCERLKNRLLSKQTVIESLQT